MIGTSRITYYGHGVVCKIILLHRRCELLKLKIIHQLQLLDENVLISIRKYKPDTVMYPNTYIYYLLR